jgi:hypothetical protein
MLSTLLSVLKLDLKEQLLPQRAIGSGSIGRLNNENELIAYSIGTLLYEIPLHAIRNLKGFHSSQSAALFTVHLSVSSASQTYMEEHPVDMYGLENRENNLRRMNHWVSLWSMDNGAPRLFASTVHGGLINDMSVVLNIRMTVHRRLRKFGSSTPCESKPGYSRNQVKLAANRCSYHNSMLKATGVAWWRKVR